jgi:hypothetical protein
MGAATLAEALRANTALTSLIVNSNSIGDAGAVSFAEALRVNAALMDINLWNNPFSAAGAAALEAAVASNPSSLVPVTAAQRMAFFTGHLRRQTHQLSPLSRLPLDLVRRILTRYKVAQGKRVWDGGRMTVGPPEV